MLLQFSDGTTLIQFSYETSGNLLRRYTPQVPEFEHVTSESSLLDGGEQPVASYRNVTETAEVAWTGTLAEQRVALQTLNRLFQQARHRQRTGMGAKVWVEFSPAGDGAYDDTDNYRSEVLSGRVLVDDAYRTGLQLEAEQLLSQIVFTRRFYWEGAETQLPLTNDNGTDDLTGLLIYNCQDDGEEYGTRVNYVAIDGADVEGDLPAPVRLELTNTYATEKTGTVWIGHNVWSDPSGLDHVIEGEDATAGLGSDVASGSASGGYVRRYTTVTPDTWYEGDSWTLSSALLTSCAGNYFQLVARFATAPVNLAYYRFKVRLKRGAATIWESAPFGIDTGGAIVPLLAMRVPPWRPPSGDVAACTLQLRLYRNDGGDDDLDLDFFHLFATDSYAMLRFVGAALDEGDTLVFDSIEDNVYVSGAAGATGSFVRYGTLIMLEPAADQRLYFAQASWIGYAEIDRTMTVKAYYRPRRLAL
ncbi:MAG: hypothetical protein PHQ60_15730 [Sideroxydans sp.]|nr:hypothetical protein [Sideroxydans sp.]